MSRNGGSHCRGEAQHHPATFAAWAVVIHTDENRLVNLMGRASKQIIQEVYGRYVEGLEQDRLKTLAYFSKDFKRGRKTEKELPAKVPAQAPKKEKESRRIP